MVQISGSFLGWSQVSVKALRFYDELGLLRPLRVDDITRIPFLFPPTSCRVSIRILALKGTWALRWEQIAPALDGRRLVGTTPPACCV